MPEREKRVKTNREEGKLGPGEGAGGDVGDRGRNRVTAEVSHVYFYSAACLCVKESQLNRHVIPFLFHISRSEIKSTVKGFSPLRDSCGSSPYEKLQKTKHTPLQSATTKRHSESSNTNL